MHSPFVIITCQRSGFDQAKDQLTKINEYAVRLIQEKEYFSITNISISKIVKILNGLVSCVILVYSAFLVFCMVAMANGSPGASLATTILVGFTTFVMTLPFCWPSIYTIYTNENKSMGIDW